MKIGELAQKAGCNTETIRYYEKQKLLSSPLRGENNYRYYTQNHLNRLVLIRNCRSLDMSLDEVKALLTLIDQPQENCHQVSALLKNHIEHIRERVEQLNNLEHYLIQACDRCNNSHSSNECVIVEEIMELDPNLKVKPDTHLS